MPRAVPGGPRPATSLGSVTALDPVTAPRNGHSTTRHHADFVPLERGLGRRQVEILGDEVWKADRKRGLRGGDQDRKVVGGELRIAGEPRQ